MNVNRLQYCKTLAFYYKCLTTVNLRSGSTISNESHDTNSVSEFKGKRQTLTFLTQDKTTPPMTIKKQLRKFLP